MGLPLVRRARSSWWETRGMRMMSLLCFEKKEKALTQRAQRKPQRNDHGERREQEKAVGKNLCWLVRRRFLAGARMVGRNSTGSKPVPLGARSFR